MRLKGAGIHFRIPKKAIYTYRSWVVVLHGDRTIWEAEGGQKELRKLRLHTSQRLAGCTVTGYK
jgi:hypothetical protein